MVTTKKVKRVKKSDEDILRDAEKMLSKRKDRVEISKNAFDKVISKAVKNKKGN